MRRAKVAGRVARRAPHHTSTISLVRPPRLLQPPQHIFNAVLFVYSYVQLRLIPALTLVHSPLLPNNTQYSRNGFLAFGFAGIVPGATYTERETPSAFELC